MQGTWMLRRGKMADQMPSFLRRLWEGAFINSFHITFVAWIQNSSEHRSVKQCFYSEKQQLKSNLAVVFL
jgi:hypothetical protein